MRNYLTREALHTLFGVGVAVAVAVAAELTDIASLEDVSLAGLAVTIIRSAATAVLSLGSRWLAARGS